MAKKKMTKCAICKQAGGRFRFRAGSGDYVHVGRCGAIDKPRDGTHKNWPIVTNNVGDPNDGPVTINSLHHLRQVEREYGVQSDCYNNDSSNW